jgi:DNA-binding transcriptional LysR family regulator
MTNMTDLLCVKTMLRMPPRPGCRQRIDVTVSMHMVHSPLTALDLNLLVVLQAVLAERNVTRAARRVGLSQSAASHALARLRQVLLDPLLVRSGRRLDLTPRAVALLPALERGLLELSSAVTGEPRFDPRTARRSFTMSMADYGQAVLLPPVLARLRAQAPGFDLAVVAFPNTLELMDTGKVDLALLTKMSLPSGYTSRRLFNDGFVCMVRQGHRAVTGPRLSLRQYPALDHLVVAPAGSPGSVVDDELDRRGLTRRIAVRVSSSLWPPGSPSSCSPHPCACRASTSSWCGTPASTTTPRIDGCAS